MAFSIHTLTEAAKEFGIGKEALRNRIKIANLTPHKVGNMELITGDELVILKNMPKPTVGRPTKK